MRLTLILLAAISLCGCQMGKAKVEMSAKPYDFEHTAEIKLVCHLEPLT